MSLRKVKNLDSSPELKRYSQNRLKMGGHDRCSVAGCDNDERRPKKNIQRGHVQELVLHRFPKDEKMRAHWIS